MLSCRLRYGLISFVCLASAAPAPAYYSVRGVTSVTAGTGACNDSQLVNAVQLPSVATSAGCVAPSGASASGETIADLTTGSVGLYVVAAPLPSSSSAAAQAEFTDQLHFSVPGGIGQNEDLLVDVTFTLDGVVSPTAIPVYAHFLDYNFEFYDFSDPSGADYSFVPSGSIDAAPFAGPLTFTKTVKLHGSFLTANVSILLGAPGIYDGSVDFFHTATVAIDAPPGVTFTSDSGVFLTAPEPAGAALGAASLLALAGLRQRRLRLP
jgi:hypothetical protein